MIRRIRIAVCELHHKQQACVLAVLVLTVIGAMVLLWLFTLWNRRTDNANNVVI